MPATVDFSGATVYHLRMEQVWYCACCGQPNETYIERTAGDRQELVEPCAVCCRANVLTLRYNDLTEGYDIDIYLEDRG